MTLKIEGQRFGRLLAVRPIGSVKKKIIWKFVCDCGSEPELPATLVVSGHTSSCGCLRIEAARESVMVDVDGQRFGRLLVIGRSGASVAGRIGWICRCDCGKEVVRPSKNLVNGTATSCGCRKLEAGAQNIEARRVDLTGRRFGKLIVLGDGAPSASGARRLMCACDCGGIKLARHGDIHNGKVVSCGCAARDNVVYMTQRARLFGAIGSAKRRARLAGSEGRFTAAQVADLFQKQRGKCACCGKKLGANFHRDHKIPLSRGGSNDILNIELLCARCNLTKHDMDPIEWANKRGMLC